MSNTREEKKHKTRKAIIAAAVKLFEQKGFEKTSIEELAREAGIGKGTIYTYFQTKTEIFYAFCEEQLEFVHAELARKTDPSAPLIEQMMTVFMGEFIHVSRNKEFGRIFMQWVLFPSESDRSSYLELDHRWLDLLFAILKRAQKKEELRQDVELLHLAGHFYALYILVVSSWYTGRIDSEEVSPGMRLLFSQALEGLAPKPAATSV